MKPATLEKRRTTERSRFSLCLVLGMVMGLWFMSANRGEAHAPGLSTLHVGIRSNGMDLTLVFSTKEARDLAERWQTNAPSAGGRKQTAEAILLARAASALEVLVDEEPVEIAVRSCQFDDHNNATIQFRVATSPRGMVEIRSRWLGLLPDGHRQFLSVRKGETLLAERLLSARAGSAMVEWSAK